VLNRPTELQKQTVLNSCGSEILIMLRYYGLYCCLLILLAGNSVFGQSAPDTLTLARNLKAQGQLRDASGLLKIWCAAHPSQPDALWLYAQTEFWRKNFNKSRHLYRQAVALQPDNLYLRLDYAETLLSMGRYAQAGALLQDLSPQEQQDPYSKYVEARRLFWTGDLAAARKLARTAENAGSKEAAGLLRETELARSPWLRLTGLYTADTQPLQRVEPVLETGIFLSKWADLRLRAASPQFQLDDRSAAATLVEASNTVRIPNTGTAIGLRGGLYQLSNQSVRWTGGLDLAQRLSPSLQMHIEAAQKPYLYTLASVDASLVFRQMSGALEWREPHGFWAKTGVQADVFDDDNQVTTLWAWALLPSLTLGNLSARVGYAYSLADARASRFVSEKTIAELLDPWAPDVPIRGIYAPYFTPKDMVTHMAIATLDWRLSKYISLTATGKYGFAATAENPYLYLDTDAGGALFFQRGFQKTDFTPFEAGGKVLVQLSDRLSIEGHYTFTRIFFYDLQSAGGNIKFIF
jgi:tetratricopeptide (TPR) repeat protein